MSEVKRPLFTRPQESAGKEFGVMVMARLKPGDLIIEGPPKTYEEIVKSDKFREVATRVLKDFAVSGTWNREKRILQRRTDLDGKVSLGLLELAGFDVSKVEYVKPGESKLGFFNIDTGNVHGVRVQGDLFQDKLEQITGWCDNHGEESKQGSSSAEFLYQGLTELGFVPKNDTLDRLIEFTNRTESGNFDWKKEFWRCDRTVIGFARFMNFKMLYDWFSSGHSFSDEIPDTVLDKWSENQEFLPKGFKDRRTALVSKIEEQNVPAGKRHEELKRAGLITIKERCAEQKKIIDVSREQLERLEREGFIVATDYGKMVVLAGGRELWGGYSAAYGYGANGFLAWNPPEESFVVSLHSGKITADFRQGVKVRDHIWIKPSYAMGRLTLSLKEVLEQMHFRGSVSSELSKVFAQDQEAARGLFNVRPELSSQGNYTAYIDRTFAVFPRDWKPEDPNAMCKVRVAEIKKDQRNRDFYILEPVE